MGHARKVFDKMPEPNTATWNAMFNGYSLTESHRDVVVLFAEMNRAAAAPLNHFTLPIVVRSCSKAGAVREGEQVHCVAAKRGFKWNSFLCTALIEMYSAKGSVGDAYKVFGEMPERNVVVWTAMISAYISCGDVGSGRRLLDLAPERDVVMWSIVISGYIESGDMVSARELFDKMPNRDVMSWNTLLNGYANSGDVGSFEKVFEEMPERNVYSWNVLIGGYARNGRFSDALEAFKQMLVEGDVVPNDFTLVAVLLACSRLGALDMGKWVHVYAESIGYKGNMFVGNALIDMYAKCGVIESAVDVFNCLDRRDIISWNTMINGLAMHGNTADALSLFDQMKNSREQPDGVTFVGILSACTHMGLVRDGFLYFQSMVDHYSIIPQIEHYGCMADLLGRAGLLDQAVSFVRKMPMEPDAVIWTSLLGACRTHKNVEIAELALQHLIELEPKNPANFVMLSNIYKDLGRWQDVARLKIAMRDTGFRKLPGCSVIECNDSVVEFYSLDERHPETESIYRALRGLTMLLRLHGYVPNLVDVAQGT
ncbi:pentatricopeptide repeat-containing protein At1g08070, chloroplastic [Lotus japonicus]|uniref:pentatricopeptide repeat-containing protein At1g08070, chloroplastic n=1 Tax=Lotus japonicus TaxID=34305 RepID=UPI0025894694|nr:pentatricopeptide repeat-containing protein At1g08070, chloroplastic [Lotus japonicus]XP_057419955.1 pentatricopeptide repeat-containing protein At1g08070, chloroplastic [Lotus japonicus]XP_057419956.1 pentatricopeptide repeat-containing protein At1g08070, chloroplastic [Lotus japonicus]